MFLAPHAQTPWLESFCLSIIALLLRGRHYDPAMIDYAEIVAAAGSCGEPVAQFLRTELPHVWRDEYLQMTPGRRTNIYVITRGAFDYIFDDYQALEASGVVEPDATSESRVVAVIGAPQANPKVRDDARLRGWVGPTQSTFGKEWDKGHFIAHSIGGAVDGSELNVFLQLRALNRGWSDAGRRYRAMEAYCAATPGVLCWSRPIYDDPSAKPAQLEFGILKPDGLVWHGLFENR